MAAKHKAGGLLVACVEEFGHRRSVGSNAFRKMLSPNAVKSVGKVDLKHYLSTLSTLNEGTGCMNSCVDAV